VAGSVGVYISVPFCRAKCTYCNFASGVFGAERMEQYVDRVCAEIRGVRAEAERLGAELPGLVDSVYLGGGTPSLLGAGLVRRLFEGLRGEFEFAANAEITLECAPGQLGGETLEELQRQGMNRVSFGVQSFVDREAVAVGRLHTRGMCLEEIERLRGAGVSDINVDLIVGLPHQTAESWRESVEVAVGTGVPHVSVYMLEVDEESRLGREMLAAGERYGAGAAPSEDATADWYGAACEWLADAGIGQYEISNFARMGFESGKSSDHRSRHNMKYWRREPYVGFGLDAHSMLRTAVGAVRRANTDDLEGYLGGQRVQGPGPRVQSAPAIVLLRGTTEALPEVEAIGREQGFEEALFLGLRMNVGVDLDRLRVEFGDGLVGEVEIALGDVEEAGLVVREGSWVRLTGTGRTASNEVFSRLLVVAA
jgi:oxygen-independent coproporphyrinogen III oxidase